MPPPVVVIDVAAPGRLVKENGTGPKVPVVALVVNPPATVLAVRLTVAIPLVLVETLIVLALVGTVVVLRVPLANPVTAPGVPLSAEKFTFAPGTTLPY